jgi:predicted RNA-binding protein YlqC (UPF0109 family)
MPDLTNDFLAEILSNIVDSHNEINIRRFENDQKIIFYITTAQKEAGQIIGKNGRLANAIRLVLIAHAKKMRITKNVYLVVIDPNAEKF